MKTTLHILISIVCSVIVYLTMIKFGASTGVVKGTSMEPTYHEGDYVLLKSYPLLFNKPNTGDVVVLVDNDKNVVIKRIVATPGSIFQSKRLDSDEYAVMGDNRNDSHDSRNYGPVKAKQIKGIVN